MYSNLKIVWHCCYDSSFDGTLIGSRPQELLRRALLFCVVLVIYFVIWCLLSFEWQMLSFEWQMLVLFDYLLLTAAGRIFFFVPEMCSYFQGADRQSALVRWWSWGWGKQSVGAESGCAFRTECWSLKQKQIEVWRENWTNLCFRQWTLELLVYFQTSFVTITSDPLAKGDFDSLLLTTTVSKARHR